MWRAPKLHLAAGAFIVNETPLETIFMSMLLEQYKRIKRLESKLQLTEYRQIGDWGFEIGDRKTENADLGCDVSKKLES